MPTAGGRVRTRPTLAAAARGGSAQRPSAEVSFSEQLQLDRVGMHDFSRKKTREPKGSK